jgi:hypothetical protein
LLYSKLQSFYGTLSIPAGCQKMSSVRSARSFQEPARKNIEARSHDLLTTGAEFHHSPT